MMSIDLLGRSTEQYLFEVSARTKFMTTSELSEREAMVSSQQLWVSMCGGMPWPGSYLTSLS
jgi:hypothetical protein